MWRTIVYLTILKSFDKFNGLGHSLHSAVSIVWTTHRAAERATLLNHSVGTTRVSVGQRIAPAHRESKK